MLIMLRSVTYQVDIPMPYAVRPPSTIFEPEKPGGTLADAAIALGVPLLNHVTLPPTAREIRITEDYPMVVNPTYSNSTIMLRLVEFDGKVLGELLYIRRGPYSSRSDEKCIDSANGLMDTVCVRVAQLKSGPTWEQIAANLETLGAWSLSEKCDASGPLIADGGGLQIHRLVGDQFSSYYCSAPKYRLSAPGRTAQQLLVYLHDLAGMATELQRN